MSRAFICDHCERLFASWKGLVNLLDMDNVQCWRNGQPRVVPIEQCNSCLEATWEPSSTSADDWELYSKEVYFDE
jgi:hypothetical protein